jgi:NAD(P)-dependent dehydrogenase (short-subunit alcohol dehydrogenase family)
VSGKVILFVVPKPVAIVTGAVRGIGQACALALAESGFELVLNDIEPFESSLGVPHIADLADLDTHAALVQTAMDRFGRIDCLVNNAGVSVLSRGDLLDVTPESFDRCVGVNTRAVFFLSQAVAKAMLRQDAAAGHRSIVNITSSNAVAASITRGEYCVSKSATSMTTKLFGLRLAEAGIGVYEIRPGVIETEMTRPVKEHYDARMSADDSLVPMRRWGQPSDVAATVRLLAEGRLPYTVGQAIAVDGGMTVPHY